MSIQLKKSKGVPTNESIRATCAKIAAKSWGEINMQRTPIRGQTAMWFSCSGHGGYVVFNDLQNPTWNTGNQSPDEIMDHRWAFYIFEEDCNWAVFELLNPAIEQSSYESYGGRRVAFDKYHEKVIACVKRWNPDVLLLAVDAR